MSLINQMLKDIDKRHAASSTMAANHDLQGVIKSTFPWRTVLLGGSLMAALIAAGLVVLNGKRAPVSAPVVVASSPAPLASASVASAPVTGAAPVVVPSASAPAVSRVVERPPVLAAPTTTPTPAPVPVPTFEMVSKPVSTKTGPSGVVTRVLTASQRAENLYRDAVEHIRQGQMTDAQSLLKRALSEYALHHASRQLLARAMLDAGQIEDAKTVLRDGLTIAPERLDFYMALAQVNLVGNDLDAAIKVMESGLPVASDNAEFHAFLATVLQRGGRHDEAIEHYAVALRKIPDSANWLLGLGISLQEKKDKAAASEAYARAIDLGLSPSLMQFAQDRLRQLNR